MYIYNARIYTLDPLRPTASALAIQAGRIVAVGDEAAIWAEYSAAEEALDLHGQVILPGLTDAHMHLESYALGLQRVDCETATRQECLERVAARARLLPPGEWILGHGWNQNNWSEGFGCAADLDAVAPNHPVYLSAKSYHAGWANSLALQRAGVQAATPDPLHGRLGRDASGAPDGILFESAMDLVAAAIPEPTLEQTAEAIALAQAVLWRMGLTGLHDFDGRSCFSALQSLRQQDRLHLRVLKGVPLPDLPYAVGLGLCAGFGDDFLRIGAVKAFMDGALGPQTAAMIQPFTGASADNRGMLFMDAEQLFEHGRLAAQNGLPLAVHAIGDRANHEALLAFQYLRQFEQAQGLGLPGNPLRHRIEHVQLLHPADVSLLAALGVTASMQPIHATSDMLMADRYWGERAAFAYAWKSQLDQGANLAFGSDAPVESPNPFWGLHAAVTRCRQDGSPGAPGWIPEQRIGLQAALLAYTQGAAYAAGMEDRLGRLAPGFLADLIVLEQDPFEVAADDLWRLQPAATLLAGEWVYP